LSKWRRRWSKVAWVALGHLWSDGMEGSN